jgi:alpha-beta hydrolase superfamily lysophospholipase
MTGWEPLEITYTDGYRAFARFWRPDACRGAVLYLHGIQSHGLWFEASAQRLVDAGFAVMLPDRRGSGRNALERGHAPSAVRLLEDVGEGLDVLRARTGVEAPQVLGVSWGGKLAMAFVSRSPRRVPRVTLVAPGLCPKVDLPRSQKVRVGISMIAGGHSRFDIPLQQAELFTENPARQTFIRGDGLALRQVTGRFLIVSRKLDSLAQRVRVLPEGPPLCLFLASEDRIIDNAATSDFVRRLSWADRRIIEYPGAHHTLDFEPDPEPFFRDLVAWVGERR